MKLITAALLLGAVSAVSGKTSNLRSSRQLQDEVVYGTYLEADIQYADHSDGHLDAIALPDGTILDIEDADDADADVKNRGRGWFRKHGFNSGDTQISLTGRVEGSKFKLKKLPQGKALAKGKDKRRLEEDRRRLMTGTYSVLALRVIANDASTSSSEATISDEIFGTSGDVVNLKSQYAECSNNQLIFEPATGTGITNGVKTVTINENVSGVDNSVIRNAVTNASGGSSQADYVMQCLPPGTSGGWIAYAYINWYLSVYNDKWCNYPSGQLHELGHNIGLAHAGEGTAQYADQSGMMGYSYSQDETPLMCFNAAKNYQLGWFSDRFHGMTLADTTPPFTGDLIGAINYGSASGDQKVGIRITGAPDDYYVSFNHATGKNSGTVEGQNKVLVHKRATGTGYSQSWLMAKLSAGGTYTSDTTPAFEVKVNSINTSTGIASVFVGVATAPTNAPTQQPTLPPTPGPTPGPTLAPTDPAPTKAPTEAPTKAPTTPPTSGPTLAPTDPAPTKAPTEAPTNQPTTSAPTNQPTTGAPTESPSASPTKAPSISPTKAPTNQPTAGAPTKSPTEAPTSPFSCEAKYSSKDTCNPDARCFWGTKSSCTPTNSGNTARNKCCPSSGGPTPSPPPTPSPGPGPGPGPEPATCGEIPDNGTCKATSGCRWRKGSCVDGNGGAEFCFGKNGSCSTDSDCCSGSCKGNGRCE